MPLDGERVDHDERHGAGGHDLEQRHPRREAAHDLGRDGNRVGGLGAEAARAVGGDDEDLVGTEPDVEEVALPRHSPRREATQAFLECGHRLPHLPT